jgi:hypothetical protein
MPTNSKSKSNTSLNMTASITTQDQDKPVKTGEETTTHQPSTTKNYCFAHNTYYVTSWCPTCTFHI